MIPEKNLMFKNKSKKPNFKENKILFENLVLKKVYSCFLGEKEIKIRFFSF